MIGGIIQSFNLKEQNITPSLCFRKLPRLSMGLSLAYIQTHSTMRYCCTFSGSVVYSPLKSKLGKENKNVDYTFFRIVNFAARPEQLGKQKQTTVAGCYF